MSIPASKVTFSERQENVLLLVRKRFKRKRFQVNVKVWSFSPTKTNLQHFRQNELFDALTCVGDVTIYTTPSYSEKRPHCPNNLPTVFPSILVCQGVKGAIIFFGRGWVPNLQKVGINKIKLQPPISATKMPPPRPSAIHLVTKQAKIVLKSVFLNKINTLSVVIV